MKIKPERSIENDVYSTVIKPIEFGTSDITSVEELEILKDTPQTLKYSDIKFEDKFTVKDGLPEISSDPDAVTVTLKPVNKEFTLDEDFEFSCSVDAKNIPDSEVDGTVFTNKYSLAMAKVILFETKVIEQIKKLLEDARSHVTTFEITQEQTL